MIRKINLNGKPRKELAAAISEITGEKAVYQRMSTCSYTIGNITVLRDGSLECPDDSDIAERTKAYGFEPEPQDGTKAEAEHEYAELE